MMKFPSLVLLVGTIALTACSYFDSEPDKKPLPGERISVLDLQQELQPSKEANAQEFIEIAQVTNNKEWPQTGGYPHHAMQNLGLGESGQLEPIWRADIGAGTDDGLPLITRPVIADGKVFTLDTRSKVRAFHDQTGKQLWESSIRDEKEDEPVIGGGVSYAGGVLFATSGYNEVLALNPEDGKIYWRTRISAASRAAPTVKNGRVFVTGLNNNVIAIDGSTGKIIWEYEGVGETTGLLGAASPAVDQDLVVAALSSGDLIALRVENGSIAWEDSLSNSLRLGAMAGLSDIRGLPVIAGDVIFAVSYGGKMVAIDKRTGSRLWTREISSAETPWFSGNTIFVLGADYQLFALNAMNGEILWIRELPKYENPDSRKGLYTWNGPLMAGNRLMVVNNRGMVAEFEPRTGETLTNWTIKKPVMLSPVIANSALYLLADDGTLLAYR
jgi:outer membrane protein assembly factor BamB